MLKPIEKTNILKILNIDDNIHSAHGMLCGLTCVKADISLNDWFNEILITNNLQTTAEKNSLTKLTQIFNVTTAQLKQNKLNFKLLIKDDNYSLSQQAQTLTQWCNGFLIGFSLYKITSINKYILEMIKDISSITNLHINIDNNKKNAQDLILVIEFVRTGVLFILETIQQETNK